MRFQNTFGTLPFIFEVGAVRLQMPLPNSLINEWNQGSTSILIPVNSCEPSLIRYQHEKELQTKLFNLY